MYFNQNSGWGQAMLNMIASQVPAFGNIFVVTNSSDSDEKNYGVLQSIVLPDPEGQVRFYTSLSAAYDACESNNNDIILLDANSTHSLTAALDWTKNRIHVFGMDGGDRLVQQGAKVQLGGAIDAAYVVKVTGVRNSFRNVKFIMASTHANALSVVQMGGEGNLYKNCSFTFGVVDNLDQTTAHEIVCGEDSGTFIDCYIGTETLLTSAARSVFHIDQVTNGQEFKSNFLRGCHFLISSSSSTATFVRLDAVGDILFSNVFDNCRFTASIDSAGGAAIAEASQTGTGTVKGTLNYYYPATAGVTDFATATSGRNANTFIMAPVPTAGTAGLGIAPTA